MGLLSSLRSVVHQFSAGQRFTSVEGGQTAANTNVKAFANWLINQSNFSTYQEEALYEHFYKYESEVAGSIERMASMVRDSYKGFVLKNPTRYDNLPDFKLDDVEVNSSMFDVKLSKEMLDVANHISDVIKINDLHETYAEILQLHGMLLLEVSGLSHVIIPNARATIIDTMDRSTGTVTDMKKQVITEANIIMVDERQSLTERKITNFIIKKYKDTPLSMKDKFGRDTYGIYAVSPLQRALIPIWQKRLIIINDLIWRNKNVPREHHTISTEAFNPLTYTGTPMDIKQAMDSDVSNTLLRYKSTVEDQPADMTYITTDAVEIKSIEHSGTSYMSPNELLAQISSQVWSALNVPKSIVEGSSQSTYASELLISSYTSMRVKQMAEKIGEVIMENMKLRLLAINPRYPVDLLKIKYEFVLDNNKLESMKTAAVAASLNAYTRSEIREMGNSAPPITDEQLKDDIIINTGGDMNGKDEMGMPISSKSSSNKVSTGSSTPITGHSANQQPTAAGSSVIDNVLQNKTKKSNEPSIK